MRVSDKKIVLGVVCALKLEALSLISWFPEPEFVFDRGHRWIRWNRGDCQIIVVISRRPGKDAARKATRLLIETYHPGYILNFGTAGAIAPHSAIGDMVLSYRTAAYCMPDDFGLLQSGTEFIAQSCCENFSIHSGIIVSSDQNIDNDLKKQILWETYGAWCGDWESAPVMAVCSQYGIPAHAFRVISDFGNAEFLADFFKNATQVLTQAALVLKALLQSIEILPSTIPANTEV
ncbi:MAG: 5'-methylthioadenosine/S-adenosylhomocysteine nucleosidase [SAR324 cluster bacterium]|nr:5'-methylthioadenosine/S-adenosylhomocysteine nucleosidase [SAR324 cluster bacterium]